MAHKHWQKYRAINIKTGEKLPDIMKRRDALLYWNSEDWVVNLSTDYTDMVTREIYEDDVLQLDIETTAVVMWESVGCRFILRNDLKEFVYPMGPMVKGWTVVGVRWQKEFLNLICKNENGVRI